MTLQQRLNALITSIGTDIKSLIQKQGDLVTLNTTSKSNLVSAINEVLTKEGDLSTLSTTVKSNLVVAINEVFSIANSGANVIDDASTSANDKTWSVSKIKTEIALAITNLINGADGASDTLKELADQILALSQADAGLISAVSSQTFTPAQKSQARNNIDAYGSVELGNPDTDLVALYTLAKSQ
jgi:23S rRNA pseudoU1915 N3-methylase RlmH